MLKEWLIPEIVTLDLQETMNSNQPDMEPDGAYGDVFLDNGVGKICNRCS